MRYSFPIATFLGYVMTTDVWAQDEGALPDWREFHPPLGYWAGIVTGGPIFVALHLLIVLTFVAAIVATLRHASALVSVSLSIAPFVFGSIAMWFGIWALDDAARSLHFEGDVFRVLPALPRPFYLGFILTVGALILPYLLRALHTPESPSKKFDF